jgi:hypothetical protein
LGINNLDWSYFKEDKTSFNFDSSFINDVKEVNDIKNVEEFKYVKNFKDLVFDDLKVVKIEVSRQMGVDFNKFKETWV